MSKKITKILEDNSLESPDTLILINEINTCQKCNSNENLCMFHTELVETSLIIEAKKDFNKLMITI